MTDITDVFRVIEQAEINAAAADREALVARVGDVWNTEELQRDFEVIGFLAPYVMVRRKSDSAQGSLRFQHAPRLYFQWEPHAK